MTNHVLSHRSAGVLLHPTSLPGVAGNGDLGAEAYHFVDFLADSGFTLWQTLPLGPTHGDLSPYQCQSVNAGSYKLINLQLLAEHGWLADPSLNNSMDIDLQRRQKLREAFAVFMQSAVDEKRSEFEAFKRQHQNWLDDFSLYQALRGEHQNKAWFDWPVALRDRQLAAMDKARKTLSAEIEQANFEQFVFYQQWLALRQYANDKGVRLFGDIPIFVAHDSSDVWAHPELFTIDEAGALIVVAGVPPDYFSETGQRWGNPLYNWENHAQDNYAWWVDRIKNQIELFDLLRIDHFRGFEAAWEISADEETAMNGEWVKGPGKAFFERLRQVFGELPLVAEDLGVITDEVNALRQAFDLPGMKILQFAFDGSSDNPYLPHNHESLSVVYTGTHDNNTTRGWWAELTEQEQHRIRQYFGHPADEPHWLLMRAAFASVANLAVVPMQDILGLGGEDRMNIPGVADHNWLWRFDWSSVSADHSRQCRDMIHTYGRN